MPARPASRPLLAASSRRSLGGLLLLLGLAILSLGLVPIHETGSFARAAAPADKIDPAAIPPLERFDWQPKEIVGVAAEHLGRQASPVTSVAYHPDSKLAVSGGTNGLVRLWDAETMRLIEYLSADGSAVYAVAISKDGKRLAAGTVAGNAVTWDLDEDHKATRRHLIKISSQPVWAVAFSPPDGTYVTAGSQDATVQVWDVSGAEAKAKDGVSHAGPVFGVAYSPDGKRLASCGGDKFVRLWNMDLPRMKEIMPFEGHTDAVRAVAFSPDDKQLVSVALDGTMRFWSPTGAQKKEKKSVTVSEKVGVYSVAFTSDSKTLATGGADSLVRIWGLGGAAPKEEHKLSRHEGLVAALAFSPEGDRLYSGSHDWTSRMWQLKKGKPFEKTVTVGHLSSVYALTFSPDGKTLASSAVDGTIRLWDLPHETPKEQRILKGNPTMVTMTYSKDGKSLFAANPSGLVKVWDPTGGKERRQFTAKLTGTAFLAVLAPGGDKVLFGTRDKTLQLWDVGGEKELGKLQGHEALVNSIAFSASGRRVLTGAGELLYKDGQPVMKDGKYVWTDPTVRLWDVQTRKQLHVVGKHVRAVSGVALTPDGQRQFSSDAEVLDIRQSELGDEGLKELRPLRGPNVASQLVTSPDGKRLFSFYYGVGTVWSIEFSRDLNSWKLKEHVSCATFSPDGQYLAIGLWTGVVYIVKLGPPPED